MQSADKKHRLCGLLIRKERWSLSWKARLLLLLAITSLAVWIFFRVHPFLAITSREKTETLVVEGWIHGYAIRAAVTEFNSGKYQHVYATGGPVSGQGGYINDFNTSASVGADQLRAAGLAPDLVHMVPSRVIDRDRTYSAAVALRDWFRENHVTVQRINVVTEGVHARRSRLLFQKAFGKEVKVGIIAVPNADYDSAHWWRYSEGVKELISEGAAYLYVRLFFHPSS